MGEPAIIAVQEETARIGNVQVKKERALVATEDGIFAIERHRVEQHQPISYLPPQRPALPPPPPPPAPVYVPVKTYSWYDPRDKDCCVAFLVILMWIVIAVVAFPFFVLGCVCYIWLECCDD